MAKSFTVEIKGGDLEFSSLAALKQHFQSNMTEIPENGLDVHVREGVRNGFPGWAMGNMKIENNKGKLRVYSCRMEI